MAGWAWGVVGNLVASALCSTGVILHTTWQHRKTRRAIRNRADGGR